jgi:hypothetical protein
MSDVFKKICKLFQIEKLNTVAYLPESNGALERTHKTLVVYLRSYVDTKPSNWDQWLPFACFMFNTTPLSITRYSPYELLFRRKCNLPGELEQKVQPLYNYGDIVKVIKYKLQESHHIAQKNLIKFKEKQSKRQNGVFHENINKNDLILLKKENRKNKLDPI